MKMKTLFTRAREHLGLAIAWVVGGFMIWSLVASRVHIFMGFSLREKVIVGISLAGCVPCYAVGRCVADKRPNLGVSLILVAALMAGLSFVVWRLTCDIRRPPSDSQESDRRDAIKRSASPIDEIRPGAKSSSSAKRQMATTDSKADS